MFKIGDEVRIISGSFPASAHQSFVGRVGRITGVWVGSHGKPTTDVPYPWKLEVGGVQVPSWFATSELELFGPNPTPTPAITLIEAENVELKKQLDYYKSNRDWWIHECFKEQQQRASFANENRVLNEAYLKEEQRANTLQKDADRWQYARQFISFHDTNKWAHQRFSGHTANEPYSTCIDEVIDLDMGA